MRVLARSSSVSAAARQPTAVLGMLQHSASEFSMPRATTSTHGGGALRHAARVDLSGLHPAARGAHFQLACDVDNPLLGPNGATAVEHPKGADAEELVVLEDAMTQWARVVRTATGRDDSHTPGAGAAGGTAFGAMSVLGATTRPGIDTVLDPSTSVASWPGPIWSSQVRDRWTRRAYTARRPSASLRHAGEAGVPVLAVAGRSVLSDIQLQNAGIRMAYIARRVWSPTFANRSRMRPN